MFTTRYFVDPAKAPVQPNKKSLGPSGEQTSSVSIPEPRLLDLSKSAVTGISSGVEWFLFGIVSAASLAMAFGSLVELLRFLGT